MTLSAALKFWPWLLLLVTNALILGGADPALRYPAAVMLMAVLPGWAWLRAAFPHWADPAERLTLAVGVSLALSIIIAMGAVYLPGPISQAKIVWLTDLVILTGLGVAAWPAPVRPAEAPPLSVSPRLLILLLLILLLAAALRLPRLGYAEFHEDEAEALMLGVRLLNGEDYALFLHRKGPAQMLLPLSFWLLTDQITEALARFPFALSSLLSTATLFFMGRRWFGWPAGLLAALLWAINGYAIGFGRMVQYQALIFFLGPLALYCLYLAWEVRQPAWQIIAALLLAVCLLAHFDALLLLPAAAYLGWLTIKPMLVTRFLPSSEGIDKSPTRLPDLSIRREHSETGETVTKNRNDSASPLLYSLTALLLFTGLLAAFYIPYLLDPEFSNTAAYLSESRVKPGLLYNNLDVLRRLDKDYSSHFYLPLLGGGLVSFGVWQSRCLAPRWRWALAGLGLLALSTALWPGLWRSGAGSVALLPWLLLVGLGFWRWPAPPVRAVWLLTGIPLIGYLFLVDDPRTHLYIAYPGLALVAGAGLGQWGQWLLSPRGDNAGTTMTALDPPESGGNLIPRPLRLSFILTTLMGGLLVASIILYDTTLYLSTESSLSGLCQDWDDSIWAWVYDDLPEAREYFGYPKREGWKAIGALRAQGQLPGDFRSVNEDFVVPIWYNFGQARSCYDTPAHFFVRTTGLETDFEPVGYGVVGHIIREAEPRLQILSAAPVAAETAEYFLEPLAERFDRLATPRHFTQQAQPQQPVGAQFGSAITFLGFDLETPAVAPGETLRLDLYWQARSQPATDYRAFVHLTDGTTLWGQQDDTPACRLPTSIWRAGQQGQGQFRLPISPDTPPGRYPLIIGLYQADTLERLPLTGGAGQPGDDFLWLGDVEVTAPTEARE